jgi:hypothetical protein
MDIQRNARENMNWFERVLHKIPGFKGYYEKEFRRDADHLQREFVVGQLREARKNLNHVIQSVSRQKDLEQLTEYDLFAKGLDRAINEIRYADQGYSGFFDLIKVREAELESVYQLDSELVDLARRFSDESAAMGASSAAGARIEPFQDYLRQIEAVFAKRTALLKGYPAKGE